MLFSQRAIFQSVANANTNFAKFSDFSSTTALFGGGYEGDCCKDSYLFAPDKTDVTSFFDKSGIADGYGWCGAVTFKYKTASNYTLAIRFGILKVRRPQLRELHIILLLKTSTLNSL